MTTVLRFNSHVDRLIVTTVALVNRLTPGQDGGRPVVVPTGRNLVDVIAETVATEGYPGRTTQPQAEDLLPWVQRARTVIEALAAGEQASAARQVNRMLADSGARPRLDADQDGPYRLHFHGPDDSFARGWAAGIAAGLAMAVGGGLGHRLGVCQAPACDRVWVDLSRNTHRRFCSTRCQNRVKAAAHRHRPRT
jgi:predicted RNA-binding Zn ribbon-like protein